MNNNYSNKISKRLLPLYCAAFFQGFVFWYAVEKVFMKSIGFDDSSIGLMVAIYSAVMLIAETPSGVLADRWSRKGVLILASIALSMSAIVGGLSNSVGLYLVSAALWGIYYALYSGTYNSIIYDTVLEESNSSKLYEKYLGRLNIVESAALVGSSLIGGLIASYIGLRYSFYLYIPFSILAIISLIKFKEPQLHKIDVAEPIFKHIKTTFKAVAKKGQLRSVLTVLIAISGAAYIVLEFTQLWYISLMVPIVLFGPLNATLLIAPGIAGAVVTKVKLFNFKVLSMFGTITILTSLALVFSRNLFVIAACMGLLLFNLTILRIVFNKLLQDNLKSNLRAGASSAVSTIGRIVIIPVALVFGTISNSTSIFSASWIIVLLILVALIFIFKTYRQNRSPVSI